ncbi:hypothetical protein NGA_0708800 [Nannochloropsis gaditana CCMP526]|uniref:uncharacterized protein n=1 Tax=Nannochloropsis gaditana (strain CCMP526) TaxID=1093141 RepID=UPI00029F527C|nr:hypothetical protein NGA_0708800 [Nannochloropsis gaditana CCMP526]EKU23487.1 hypothetical protein NGA_0708800 [Nannochloropsis gaditana CCMP526]|eukprot:XP_005852340.1 hypothetical protein NGA_0708800 [Nannochloropsis gaditana CCMP526]
MHRRKFCGVTGHSFLPFVLVPQASTKIPRALASLFPPPPDNGRRPRETDCRPSRRQSLHRCFSRPGAPHFSL